MGYNPTLVSPTARPLGRAWAGYWRDMHLGGGLARRAHLGGAQLVASQVGLKQVAHQRGISQHGKWIGGADTSQQQFWHPPMNRQQALEATFQAAGAFCRASSNDVPSSARKRRARSTLL